jgi:GrpB-like predicted nucleotidyltransferase (UPF0157 family)
VSNGQGSDTVIVLPHDPSWAVTYQEESKHILSALSTSSPVAHHIGSTAIPKCFAKPIIDILIEVDDLKLVDFCNSSMERLGYQVMGEYGIPNRRYFRKNNESGVRLYHVHVFAKGEPTIERHLAFRDFLNQNPSWALKYSDLKRELAATYPNSSRRYTDAKTELVTLICELASNWQRTRS